MEHIAGCADTFLGNSRRTADLVRFLCKGIYQFRHFPGRCQAGNNHLTRLVLQLISDHPEAIDRFLRLRGECRRLALQNFTDLFGMPGGGLRSLL